MGWTSKALGALCATVILAACADQTAIEAVVVSDVLEVPADVDELEFDIAGTGTDDPSLLEDQRYPISTDFPHSLSIRPGPDDEETISIVVTGYKDDVEVVRSAATTATFIPGEVVTVTIRLGAAMPPVDGGMDGGMDAGVDAGDAGGGDAGCTSAAACDDGVACTVDTCDDGLCVNTPDDSVCEEGTTCDPTEGCPARACEVDDDCLDSRTCNGDEMCNASMTCEPGTPIDCSDGDTCTDDRCDDSAGGCVYSTKDADGDGFGDATCAEVGGVPATDCDDDSPDTFPGADEVCNGADDDCDGTCDDSFTCCRGEVETCTTSCRSTGTRLCDSSCTWESTCTPPTEACSGTDTDCDGMIDEGFECVAGRSRSCTTTCGTIGLQTCSTTTCVYGSCVPPTETCNGVDDDCDGTTDEGCGACSACSGSTTVSAPGGRYSVSLGAHSRTGSCGGAGSEAYLTFTLSDTSDVFITTHDTGSIDTVVYVRDCTCDGTEVACNDDADGLTTSMLRLTSLAAGTYNVIVDTKAAVSADVSVDVYISPPGAESDRCGNPTFIPAGTTNISGNTCSFSHDYDITADSIDCQYAGAGDTQDVVYYFYLPTSRSVNFGGCLSGVTVDEVFYIREVCSTPGATNQVACNDDGCGGPPSCSSKYRADLYATLGPGLYYFIMDGWDPDVTCDCGDWQAMLSGI